MKRGVMLPPIGLTVENGRTTFSIVGDIPFLHCAPAAILYWDRIFAPVAIKGLVPQYDAAVQRMVEIGIAESLDLIPVNSFSNSDIGPMVEKYSIELQRLNERLDEVWSVMPIQPSVETALSKQTASFLERSELTISSIEVRLKSALPVPDRAIPYEDILEFKMSRKDQLSRLHSEISQIASRYASHMGDERALNMALCDMRTSLDDLHRVYSEKWVIKSLRGLTSAFAVNGLWPAGVTYLAGADIDKAFLAGAGATILHTAVAAIWPNKHVSNPYAYALDAANL